jgi:hypothetical protein
MEIQCFTKCKYHDFMTRTPAPEQRASNEEKFLQVTVPHVTKRSLKMRAARTGETMRVIVLRALAADGIPVPAAKLQGSRKHR